MILAVLETAFLLLSCAAAPPLTVLYKPDGSPERYAGKVQPGKVMIPAQYIQPAAEMRGVWIATVENIDFPLHADLAGFQKTIRSMFARLRAHNFNTVFFQVRP
ncbi:MAG: family 10 glycosylhydrolase, partial [Lentisphaeria bacterium]|nr:family 10 glycosylhydrolase [Lentisphaeria bacterium]